MHSGVDSISGVHWRNERDPCKRGLRGEETVQSVDNPVIIATSNRLRVLSVAFKGEIVSIHCNRRNKKADIKVEEQIFL